MSNIQQPRHRPRPDICSPYCTADDHLRPRALVTLHLPLDMNCVAMVMSAVAKAYPEAVIGEDGEILEYAVPR